MLTYRYWLLSALIHLLKQIQYSSLNLIFPMFLSLLFYFSFGTGLVGSLSHYTKWAGQLAQGSGFFMSMHLVHTQLFMWVQGLNSGPDACVARIC